MNKFKLFFAASFALMALGSVEVCAQNPDNEFHSTVHVSFFPPLSTNGRQAQYYSNDFSFSLLAGVSKNEEAFAFAGLANLIRNDAAGFQFAGLANYTGNEGSGFQFAGLLWCAAILKASNSPAWSMPPDVWKASNLPAWAMWPDVSKVSNLPAWAMWRRMSMDFSSGACSTKPET